MRLTEAFEAYRLEYILFRNQSRKTEENHIYACRSLVSYLGDIELQELTFDMVRQWKQDMEKRHRVPNTIRSYIIKLRVVLKHMRLQGVECINPDLIPVPQRKGNGRIDFVLAQDVLRLIKACDIPGSKHINRARNKAIVALLFSTGMRVSELCRVNIVHTRTNFFSIESKGGDNELYFIDAQARTYIDQYLQMRKDHNPSLFVSAQGNQRMTPNNVQEVFKTLKKYTGLRVSPHVMRHSFGTDLMRNGADIRYVQAMMHHKSIQTTQQYLHVVDEELHGLHEKYHTKLERVEA